jgi:SAM-dependent methyltransferase
MPTPLLFSTASGSTTELEPRGMESYYADKLSAERLRRCYELAPPPVERYLAAEIDHVRHRVVPGSRVLELGCGYGRVLRELAPRAGELVGIDISLSSLQLARAELADEDNVRLALMDAANLGFRPRVFDLVCCVQNGISAFGVDRRRLLAAAVAATRPRGQILFSSYATEFWEERLNWFRIQAAHGLVGEIDEAATGEGIIVCRDGFRASTVGAEEFSALAADLGRRAEIEVVAASSLFCCLIA